MTRWNGHRAASVLLDTYLGVVQDDAAPSLARVEDLLDEGAHARKDREP